MKKILYIWQTEYPWDIRVEKFVKSLSEFNEVHLLCRNTKKNKEEEFIEEDNYKIHRFPIKWSNKRYLSEPLHLNVFWRIFIENKIKEIKPNLIIVRNLPLAKLAIKLGKKYNIEVIFDNAENYPEFIRFFPRYDKKIFKLIDKMGYLENLENYCVNQSKVTINVIEENTDRIANKNINRDKMMEIYNVPPINEKFNSIEHEGINLCYIGALDDDNLRGTSDLIRAMALIEDKYKLFILGDGKERNKLEALVKDLKLENKVFFEGAIKYSEIKNYVSKYDIGVVPHRRTAMTDTTMANKIYEYMSWRLAVIATDAIPLKRFVNENKVGVIYESGNHIDLSEKIIELCKYNINEIRNTNYKLHIEKYNWEIESIKLLNLIKEK
ncbi:glycosyltransferase [Clostridium chauvoei]|uniref:Glycosyltransferase n=2 Tax=Clostridium chauvoei TaxID=46867 RepID=A0ABD4RF18_9CLOT|nr:glycosyltransferase [Clostridium chauvoei]ATD54261.1 hypothetical protein BTM20_03025 [Clostridium chauvoei]ATD58059.1 hypothetical protein BTM21_10060 [Clostridium chauvoei]MBX7279868.1 glycosyltransferase [Clostridium chauvoei]MBX7282214.1 glycosyltransferase [Clostridium chauvoei]MBX7284758.1 glycosyltransferase [Clostridium chauvoei]